MACRTFTTLHRQVIRDLRGNPAYTLPDRAGTGTEPLNMRVASEETRVKNPSESALYPGWTLQIDSPRENKVWQTTELVSAVTDDPDAPGHLRAHVYNPPKTFWVDYRLAVYAKTQPQYDAMIALLFRVWNRGRDQHAVTWPDDDDPDLTYTAPISFSTPIQRSRPADNVLAADYLLSVPISVYLDIPQVLPTVEQVLLNLYTMNAAGEFGDPDTLVFHLGG